MEFPVLISFSQQEDNLFTSEMFSFQSCFSSVEVLDSISFLKSSFERLEHHRVDLPVLIATDSARDFGLIDANMSNRGNCFVIASEITQRGPIGIVLGSNK